MASSSSSSSSSSPCAACKFLRRKCTKECIFSPYFPQDQPLRFSYVHKVFGASNVSKLLSEINISQREDAVNSLYYEAQARLRDPVYGCVGLISILQHHLKQTQLEIEKAKQELATFSNSILQPPQPLFLSQPLQPPQPLFLSQPLQPPQHHGHHNMLLPMMGQMFEQQQHDDGFEDHRVVSVDAVALGQHNEMFRVYGEGGSSSDSSYHQSQTQDDILRFDDRFDSIPAGSVTVSGFNQLNSGASTATTMSSSLALGGNFLDSSNNTYHGNHNEAQLFIPTQVSQPLPPQTQETQTQMKLERGG